MRQTIKELCPRQLLTVAFLATGLLAVTSPMAAQNIVPAEEPVAVANLSRADGMRESYDKYPNSSSSSLVGLSFGETAGFADDMAIFVPLPDKPETLCVRMVTQDARYFALNPYRVTDVPPGARFVRLHPVTQKHAEDLARYRPEQYAIRTYTSVADRCSAKDAVFLPHIGYGSENLIAFVNGNARRAKAELFDIPIEKDTTSIQPKSEVRCADVGQEARIAFDLECRLPLESKMDSRLVYLRLVFDDGFGKERQVYKLLLPSQK